MVTLVDQFGQPIQREQLSEPQTAHVASLHHEIANHPSRGLTPSKLARILDAAENGDVIAQYELFEDMEEKDGHVAAEMSKRRRALLSLDWTVEPPPNASAAEKAATDGVRAILSELEDFEETLFDLTDAIGKAFVCAEVSWHRADGQFLPEAITHRPQTWFQFHRGTMRQEIRLRDSSPEGAELWPFGWVTHISRAKSGYLERAALFRVLVWPYLFKNYSVGDLAEFLEIYGIPTRIGRYPSGATEKEKLTLLRALASIGHNAAGIMPQGMEVEFKDAASGDPDAFQLMIDWCERTQSKAILGATLTSQADRGSNTNALGNVHNEVRKDLRDGDAKGLGRTLTRDLVYPLAALNFGITSVRRSPRFVLDIAESEDLKLFADALPPLVKMGVKVPETWVRGVLRIPDATEGEAILGHADTAGKDGGKTTTTALRADPRGGVKLPDQAALETLLDAISNGDDQALMDDMLQPLFELAERDPEALTGQLADLYPKLGGAKLEDTLARLLFAAEAWGQLNG